LIINHENKIWGLFFLTIYSLGLYMTSNHFHIFRPMVLPFTLIDNQVPFMPGSVWTYISMYAILPLGYFLLKDLRNLNMLVWAYLILQTVSNFVFFMWPTTYPRDLYPLSQMAIEPVTYHVFKILRSIDDPSNCLPSLHVSSVYLVSFAFLTEQKEKFPIFFIWATAIAISTLTTKQHYIWDVGTGLCLSFSTFLIVKIVFDHYIKKNESIGPE